MPASRVGSRFALNVSAVAAEAAARTYGPAPERVLGRRVLREIRSVYDLVGKGLTVHPDLGRLALDALRDSDCRVFLVHVPHAVDAVGVLVVPPAAVGRGDPDA